MNEKLYEALEVSLNALEAGADMRSVLKRFPDMRDDLIPLLEAAQQARLLSVSEVPEMALQRGKARVMQHVTAMRNPTPKTRSRWLSMFTFPRLATSLAIALLFLFSGTGLVRASSGALPGDNLYSVKRTWEDVRLLMAFTPESREDLEVEFEEERLQEVDELLVEGRHETIMFAGLVTEQRGDQWTVSGISVQVTPDSKLPVEPVNVGSSIKVEGHTNTQGFVEAKQVEFWNSGISVPAFVPSKNEGVEEPDRNDNFNVTNENSNDHHELNIGTSSDGENNGNEDSVRAPSTSNFSSDSGSDGESYRNNNDSGSGDKSQEDSHNDNSDSGSGEQDSHNEEDH